jgi:4-hydroxy-2-oxoheptanedioate aldolase
VTLYPPNHLKQLLAERKTALGFWLSLNSLAGTEIGAGAGFDWLLLDAGVRSFMFPYVQTVEEARRAVAATRYPPKGMRGYSGSTRANGFGRDRTYTATYEDDLCVIIQIESPQAVANIVEYGEIDGIDAMLIGANDLAANMGHLGNTSHPDVVATFDEAARAIMATGKAAGFQFFDRDMAKRLIERGLTLAAVGGDIKVILDGTAGVLAALR